jgi:hypothetical protein
MTRGTESPHFRSCSYEFVMTAFTRPKQAFPSGVTDAMKTEDVPMETGACFWSEERIKFVILYLLRMSKCSFPASGNVNVANI